MFSGMLSSKVVGVVEGAVSSGGASAVGTDGISLGGEGIIVVGGDFSLGSLVKEKITAKQTRNNKRTMIRFLWNIFNNYIFTLYYKSFSLIFFF